VGPSPGRRERSASGDVLQVLAHQQDLAAVDPERHQVIQITRTDTRLTGRTAGCIGTMVPGERRSLLSLAQRDLRSAAIALAVLPATVNAAAAQDQPRTSETLNPVRTSMQDPLTMPVIPPPDTRTAMRASSRNENRPSAGSTRRPSAAWHWLDFQLDLVSRTWSEAPAAPRPSASGPVPPEMP
jgi:hypothetical protein